MIAQSLPEETGSLWKRSVFKANTLVALTISLGEQIFGYQLLSPAP